MSLPALKWQYSMASSLTGMNLLLEFVVPLDLANHLMEEGQKTFCVPFRVLSKRGAIDS